MPGGGPGDSGGAMVRAFGYCNDSFDPLNPGRLCRGRERWIEGLPDATGGDFHRTVVSGAVFTDDSARDARRGFSHSGVSAAALLEELFPDRVFLAFCDAGDPLALPAEMLFEEDWNRARFGGTRWEPAVRWIARVSGEQLDRCIDGEEEGVAGPRADGIVVAAKAAVTPALVDALYRLTGMGDAEDRPARLYAPTAIPEVLEVAAALVLLHCDKHGPALSIYTRAPLESDGVLDRAARAAGAFPVPFAIPPMLARWDRALYELRMDWDPEQDGEFPVPPAEDAGGRWSARRRRKEEPVEAVEAAGEE